MSAEEEFERKYMAAMKQLESSDIWRSSYSPPIHSIARKLGLKSRPPHFNTYSRNALHFGVLFAVLIGWLEWTEKMPNDSIFSLGSTAFVLCCSLIGGLGMATYYKSSSEKNGLLKWDELQNQDP